MATIYNELLIRFVRWFADAVRPCGFVLDNSVSLKNLDRGSAAAGGINVPKTAKGSSYLHTKSALSEIYFMFAPMKHWLHNNQAPDSLNEDAFKHVDVERKSSVVVRRWIL